MTGNIMNATIRKIEYNLPDKVLTNRQLESEFKDWNAAKIEKKTGIRERHIAADDETALDLAERVCRSILTGDEKEKVDFLLYCTQSPEYYLPSGSCILQDRLGIKTSAGALDFNLGCSGYVYGLALAKGLITCRAASCILLVTAETYSKYIHPKDRNNRTIFGDGAAATIIEASEEKGILEFSLGTDGRGFQNLIVPNGGIKHRYDVNAEEIRDDSGNIRTDNHLFMDGPEIFNFTIEAVPRAFSDVLEKNNTSLEDVDYVIFHQANRFMLEYLRKKIGIPAEKYFLDMLHTGNTVSATIPIALKMSLDRGIIEKGHRVLVLGFGVGYSWGGTIVRL